MHRLVRTLQIRHRKCLKRAAQLVTVYDQVVSRRHLEARRIEVG